MEGSMMEGSMRQPDAAFHLPPVHPAAAPELWAPPCLPPPPLPPPPPLQFPTMRRILAEEGKFALWRGIRPRVMFNVPSAAVCWGTYESMKTLLAST